MKAFLLAKGVQKKKLKKSLGHNLERLFSRAKAAGLAQAVALGPQWETQLKKANDYYSKKGFEYFMVVSAVKGYRNLPDIDVLDEMASALVEKLETVCLEA